MGEILCLNAGSSSLKFAVFASVPVARRIVAGQIEDIGLEPHLILRDAEGATIAEQRWPEANKATHETLLVTLLDQIEEQFARELVAVGHRVVHGGSDFTAPVRIDSDVLSRLDALCPLAPLHQSHNLSAVRTIMAARPGLPQIACFDTAFHHGQPAVATRLALPRVLTAAGMRRYGFHGISYEYIARRLGELDPRFGGRVIVAHLGNGASLCAMQNGRSVDTTMGFTALDGLVMGTRCGALDPGAVLFLLQEKNMIPDAVEHLLYNESGLLGVSGLSSDMRVLLDSDAPFAREAIELFVWQIARQASALIASLGGLDGLVFTAGIGENAPAIRSLVGQRLGWLGLEIDEKANDRGDPVISAPSSRVTVRVIPTDEERMIAFHTAERIGCARTMAKN
ncbi:acetate/propionate family kinase [Sphingomonas nostoxanthinifaciens]|uniref:acetate/propionate family kinase n=1 Tax=Sphingomonas nostoxanthinifaciens TaxID=2872652 RepID=UPI001CC1CEFF|nr:acetate/propionate family kinase [Sphingomonas nostoxanthinifaciens]UAK23090.1 acetate/propionate family kinase [Sphingomonas nostoxanthinifaciens]